MHLYRRNEAYSYHYVEPETGYSLLYSTQDDRCITLDPIATALWQEPSDIVDSAVVGREFARVFPVDNASEYVTCIVESMHQAGALQRTAACHEENPSTATDDRHVGDYPLETINFYATGECNAKCYHCYQNTRTVESRAQPAHLDQVSDKIFLQFCQTAIPLGLKNVKLTGGEPLLRADIEEIVRGLRSLGLAVCIETNAFLVTEGLADLLAKEAKLIAISIDAGSAALHDKLRRLSGSFERATQAMEMLSSRGANVQAIMTLSRLNFADLEATLAAATRHGCKSFKINMLVTLGGATRLGRSPVLLDIGTVLAIAGKIHGWESRYSIRISLDGPPCFASIRDAFAGGVGACRFTNLLGVLANGDLSYCGIGNTCPELVFGSILDRDFAVERFWKEAPPLLAARHALSRKLDGICSLCVFESSCKGSCRAFAYGEYGSLRQPHPWCQRAFEEGLFPVHYLVPGTQQLSSNIRAERRNDMGT